MNEIINEFERLKPNQKFGILGLILLTIAFYPQILIIIAIGIIAYFIIQNLPTITEQYNKGKNEVYTPEKTKTQAIKTESNNETNFCSICGLTVDRSVNFCKRCGYKLN